MDTADDDSHRDDAFWRIHLLDLHDGYSKLVVECRRNTVDSSSDARGKQIGDCEFVSSAKLLETSESVMKAPLVAVACSCRIRHKPTKAVCTMLELPIRSSPPP